MAQDLVAILTGFDFPLPTVDQSLQDLLRDGETLNHKDFNYQNLKFCLLDPSLIEIEDRTFNLLSLKTERSRPNSGRNALMVALYYCPEKKSTPKLLMRAEINFDVNLVPNADNEFGVNIASIDFLKEILFCLLGHRYVYYWNRTEDLNNLNILPEVLAEHHIRGLDMSTTHLFRRLHLNFGSHALMMLLWGYCTERIEDIDMITTDMSFGYQCCAQSAGILYLALKMIALQKESQKSGQTINHLLGYNDITNIFIRGIKANVLTLNPIRLLGLTEEEAQKIRNQWAEFQIMLKV